MNAAAVKLRPIPDECRRQTHRISEKKRAINAPLANESDWRSSQSRAGDVELVSVIIIQHTLKHKLRLQRAANTSGA